MDQLHAEPYCILCRHRLDIASPGACTTSSWATDTICFYPNKRPQDPPAAPGRAYRADVSNDEWWDPDGTGNPIHFYTTPKTSHDGAVRDFVNFTHVSCLQLARRTLGPLRARHLRDLARCFRTILPWSFSVAPKVFSVGTVPSIPAPPGLSLDTDLGLLLHDMSKKLHFKIQQMILSGVDGLCRSLLDACTTLDSAKRLETLSEVPRLPAKLKLPNQMADFMLRSVHVLGHDCLVRVNPLSILPGNPLETTHAVGAQLAYSAYGLSDLRLFFSDGSQSGWKTNGQRQWFLNTEFDYQSQLCLASDGTKFIDIINEEPNPPDVKILWNNDHPRQPHLSSRLLDFRKRKDFVTTHGGYRPMRYLPLEGLRSLTMFIHELGVVCIQANDDDKNRLGEIRSDCCVVTHYLREGEALTSLQLVFKGKTHQLGIIAVTSTGRNLYFGARQIPDGLSVAGCHYNLGQEHRLAGLFTAVCQPSPIWLDCLGVTYFLELPNSDENNVQHVEEEKEQQVHEEKDEDGQEMDDQDEHESDDEDQESDDDSYVEEEQKGFFIPYHDAPPKHKHGVLPFETSALFLTSTILKDVLSIETQVRGPRCMGLKITKRNKEIDILGQWDPCHHAGIRKIHDVEQDGKLLGLTFVLSEVPEGGKTKDVFVKDVLVGVMPDAGISTFVWKQLDKELAWLFTHEFDCVKHYEVPYSEVKVPIISSVLPDDVS
ncbi:Ff.00g021150.m01.CDS01 [Fusarium sp. VM40]|nr:Ff.00g021150.m01.CDS01 [Fusarium sp. VM40]